MSDPAVNAQLDGIISDFEGGCRARRGRAEEGAGPPEGAPRPPRAPRPAPASPTWRTRFGGPRASAAPALPPGFLPFIVFAERRQPPRGLAGRPRNWPGRAAPSRPSQGPSPRRPSGPRGPAAGRGAGHPLLRPAQSAAALPHTSFGAGPSRIPTGEAAERTCLGPAGSSGGRPLGSGPGPGTPPSASCSREARGRRGLRAGRERILVPSPGFGVYSVCRDLGGLLFRVLGSSQP